VFDRFFAVSAYTSPGIVSLLTGQAPPVHAQTTQSSHHDADSFATAHAHGVHARNAFVVDHTQRLRVARARGARARAAVRNLPQVASCTLPRGNT
jgi:hypothetical protein